MSGDISDFNSEKMKRMIEKGELDGQILINVILCEDETYILDYESDYEKEDLLLFLKSIVDDLNTQE